MTENAFGQYLKQIRRKNKLTQNKLAELSGVSNAEISRIETGQRKNISLEVLSKIAPFLNKTLAEFVEAQGYSVITKAHLSGDLAIDKKDIIFQTTVPDGQTEFLNSQFGKQIKAIETPLTIWAETLNRIALEMTAEDREKVIEYATFLLDRAKRDN